MKKAFYLTTTLPYVNAEPHIGFALELVSADIIARYKKLSGCEVFFNTGTDEPGLKAYRRACEEGKEPQPYVDEYAAKYRHLLSALGISENINFIRTTGEVHKRAAQEFWRRCRQNGYIYKKPYKVKYCVGCELEKTDSELVHGACPLHPSQPLETIEEENWFFKLSDSRIVSFLRGLYERTDFVVPDFRLNELRSLMREKGLEDFSISRLKAKMPWGVPVPDDSEQVMYVWMDALVNYISAIGWPNDETSFRKWWVDTGGVVQFAGKDQVRQQAAMWQAMLFAAGLPPSKQIVIHGFIQSGGEKMSKSLGNTIDPFALVKEYGTDAVRFYLARHIHPFEDSDFTLAKFKEAYNADLANGIGNLTSRVLTMASNNNIWPDAVESRLENRRSILADLSSGENPIWKAFDRFNCKQVADDVWAHIAQDNKYIADEEPYKKVKSDPVSARTDVLSLIAHLWQSAIEIEPIMPKVATEIQRLILEHQIPGKLLFPRK